MEGGGGGGGGSQKLRGEGGSCKYMYWFEGPLKVFEGKLGWGVMQYFADII